MSSDTAKEFAHLRGELDVAVKALLESKTNREQMFPSEDFRSALSRLQIMSRSLSRENEILRLLYFDNMYSREDAITEAESGTFRWIVEEMNSSEGTDDSLYSFLEEDDQSIASTEETHTGLTNPRENLSSREEKVPTDSKSERSVQQEMISNREATYARKLSGSEIALEGPFDSPEVQKCLEMQVRTRDAFLTWLRSGNRTYHVSGKAGSGKSTLMKFLCKHNRVRSELESWATEKKLIFAQFFFWNSGEKLQMSLEGLYRALLFETLKQCPELIPEIFPEEWNALEPATSRFDHSLRTEELKAVFNKLVGKKGFPNHRLCFFIDGLDEYEGDSLEHWNLAESLKSWASSKDIKICVSSRPHTEFMETFSNEPNFRLRLHELTWLDISRFSSSMFKKNSNFDRVKDVYAELVNEIVEEANGVFLWARLVVRSLLEGVGRHDPHSVLRKKLKSIPKDLDDLFSKLLGSINASDRERSDRIFLLANAQVQLGRQNALWFSWLDDLKDDPEFPFSSPCRGYSNEEIEKRHCALRSQLDGLSKGLLEMVYNERSGGDIYFGFTVQFFHRTVRDYLCEASRQRQFRCRLPNFDLDAVCSRLYIAELKFARTKHSYFESTANALSFVFHGNIHWIKRTSLTLSFDSGNLSEGHHRQNDRQALYNPAKETYNILSCYCRQPFSYPGETRENSGSIHWAAGLYINFRGLMFGVSRENISELHWAAWLGLSECVEKNISENSGLIKGGGEMSVLLSASLGSNLKLVRYLLQAGADPEDQVREISYRPAGENDTRMPVWMIFACRFAAYALTSEYRPYVELFLVLKEYVEFGVDTNIFFILEDHRPQMDSEGRQESKEPKLYSISLADLIRFTEPENLEVLQTLLDKRRESFWSKTNSAVSMFLPWTETSSHAGSKYTPFEFKDLESGRFRLHSCCSKIREFQFLRNGSFFRIY